MHSPKEKSINRMGMELVSGLLVSVEDENVLLYSATERGKMSTLSQFTS